MYINSAMLGTDHHSVQEKPHEILMAAITHELKQKAGFIPPAMPIETPIVYPTIEWTYTLPANNLLSVFCEHGVRKCNAWIPYLLIAWHLTYSRNRFHLRQFVDERDKGIVNQIAVHAIAMTMGGSPEDKALEELMVFASKKARDVDMLKAQIFNPVWANIRDCARTLLQVIEGNTDAAIASAIWIREGLDWYELSGDKAQINLRDRALRWSVATDEETIFIAQQLLIDILRNSSSD